MKKRILFTASVFLTSVFLFGQNLGVKTSDKKVLYDLSGRIIRNASGNVNYTQSQNKKQKVKEIANRQSLPNDPQGSVSCNSFWNFTVMGTYIGERSLKSLDIDNDGKIEMIASARSYGDYFYTLQYNSTKNIN